MLYHRLDNLVSIYTCHVNVLSAQGAAGDRYAGTLPTTGRSPSLFRGNTSVLVLL